MMIIKSMKIIFVQKSLNRKFDQVVGFHMQRLIYICTFVANDNKDTLFANFGPHDLYHEKRANDELP